MLRPTMVVLLSLFTRPILDIGTSEDATTPLGRTTPVGLSGEAETTDI